MHMCYERPNLVTALNTTVGYDKWDRGGGSGGASGGGSGWATRDRERERDRDRERDRERERERQARAHQMSHAPEPDASSLFPAPIRVNGNKDRVSQQIQNKLGDYHLAQTLLDDPSKSIGICHEPPSPAPCPPSRRERESEFKKPAHAPQNGRVHHHRSYLYNKSEAPGSTSGSAHRPPNLRIPNGYQPQSNIDSSQPPIESILREMKSLPTPLSVIEATPRKELENKFTFNPYTNRLVPNPSSNDLKTPLPKPGLDNRISNSRSSVSPDVVNKSLGLSESDDEGAATTTQLEPILSPIVSGGSPSSASESTQSDSESESSSAESSAPRGGSPEPSHAAPPPTANDRTSWGLLNFLPPAANLPDPALGPAIAHGKEKPSPISDLTESSPGSSSESSSSRRRRSTARRSSAHSSDDEPTTLNAPSPVVPCVPAPTPPLKRGRPPKKSPLEPPKKKRGRPPKVRSEPLEEPPSPPPPPPALALHDTKTQIFRKVFTPKKGDECGGKGGKGGKGKGGKGKGQVTIIEVTAPESGADDDERRHRERSTERRNEEAIARVSPPPEPEVIKRRDERPRRSIERMDYRIPDRAGIDRPITRTSNDRMQTETTSNDRISDRISYPERHDRSDRHGDRMSSDRASDRSDRLPDLSTDRSDSDRSVLSERLSEKISIEKISDKMSMDKMSDRVSIEKMSDRVETLVPVKVEADVGSGLKTGRGSERLEEASSVCERRGRTGLLVRVPLSRLRADTVRALRAPNNNTAPPPPPTLCLGAEDAVSPLPARPHAGHTPIYFSYFERLPVDALSDEERDHKYYLGEAKRLRTAAEREQEPLQRVMLYLESVLCFVLTGRVLELELDTKRAFTIYRETIEYIKSIHSMPQRFRASPHSTFSKLDILSLRVQALLYLRMFKMYNREVKEFYKVVQDYQQKVPACPESVSPTPSPADSLHSLHSAGSASSGYCSLTHAVPAHAHNALLQLTKYYTFLYVAHELWEQADCLCRLRPNQELFIAVDRKCGPLTLFSTFRHLVQYVRHAISLLKNAPRE